MQMFLFNAYLGTGNYIFVETSGGSPGLKGSFLTPDLPAGQEVCLNFWYNLNGADIGSFDVMIKVTFCCLEIMNKIYFYDV